MQDVSNFVIITVKLPHSFLRIGEEIVEPMNIGDLGIKCKLNKFYFVKDN